jgi:Tol biopolymer transport system component
MRQFGLALLLLAAACESSSDPVPTDRKDQIRHAAWAPGDNSFVYELDRVGEPLRLFTIASDGTGRKLLLDNAAFPSWSPDGTRITFQRGAGIYTYDILTEDVAPVHTNGLSMTPAWSPVAAVIAFATNNGDNHAPPDLWLASPQGLGLRRVPLPGPPRSQSDSPSWSPAGDQIAAMVRDGSSYRVFRTDTLGVDTLYLTAPSEITDSPAWHPGGGLIAYTRTIGSDLEIWAVNTDGGNRRRLVANAVDAAWSHDGTRLAFSRFNSAGVAELWYKDIGSGTETFVAAP